MTYAYNTFDAWLRGHGFASSLDDTGELRDGTAQGFFASQYSAWLTDLLAFHAEAIRSRYDLPSDQQFLITLNQNDPTGLPIISGLTAAQIGELFSDTSDFAWGGKHVRYYANSFLLLPPDQAPVADNGTANGSEDAPAVALTLTASDADAGDAIESFTLTSLPPGEMGILYTDATLLNEAEAGVAYTASVGTLTLYFAPHENFNGAAQFNYTASDGELNSAAATATITLSQQNDPATFAGGLSGSGNEDGGPIVGTLVVSDDADGMTAPNFRIESGDGASNGAAAIDLVIGQWSYTPNANFNGADHFTVSVTDDDGNVETRVIDITVNDINKFSVSTPVDTDAAADAVDENVALGTAVGVTAFASDDDATNNGVIYSLSADAGGLFAIDPNTGAVTTAAAIDREALGASMQIEVTATSQDGSSAAQIFTIAINGLNDNSPVITSNGGGANASINVTENTTAVTTLTAADADLPPQVLRYSIVGGADAAKFTINSSTGVLSFRSAPNFESPTDAGADNIYDVTVRASDGPLFDDQAIAVAVTKPDGAPIANNDVWVISNRADFIVLGDFWLTNNDSDPDGDAIFVTAVIESGGGIPWLTPTFSNGVLTGLDIANPISSGTFTLTYTLSDGSLTDTAVVTLKVISPGIGPDTITADDLDGSDFSFIDGLDGNDSITGDLILTGNAGIDSFSGGNGDNVLNGGGGNDLLFGGPGVDVLNGDDGNDFLSGGPGVDVLNGGDGTDALNGGPGDDIINGGDWDDQLLGSLGNDILNGGAGDDTYNFASSGDGTDTINETSEGGTDTILVNTTNASTVLAGLNFERVNADDDAVADDLRITFNDQTVDVIDHYRAPSLGLIVTLSAIEKIEFIHGGTAFGYSLNFFDYTLSTDASGSLDAGISGNRFIIASADTAETLNGGTNNDLLFGNGGSDNVNGGLGSDLLVGGADVDTIDGGNGNDWLVGGAGGDNLTGGSDNDMFVYTALSDSQPGAGNFDAITGFSASTNTTINSGVHTNINGDIIDLTAIDAIPGGTNQAFSFIGTANFSDAGQLRYFTHGGETIIQGNTDADTGTVEFEIHLAGVVILTQDGFNL